MILLLAVAVIGINVPFGYWRSGARKFSKAWFFHVHGSIPLAILCRMLAGIQWTIAVGALLIGSYIVGQTLGTRLRRARVGA
jgi:F0F1-type ATP synthase membrane subunit a